MPVPKCIVNCGGLKIQLAGCAFDAKAKGKIISMKPNFFKAPGTLYLKLLQNGEYFSGDGMKGKVRELRVIF